MSEREEEVPELDAEAQAFLARHAKTGEPSPAELERVHARLVAPPPASQSKPATVTRLPTRRPMFPPEVKAAAAVVILLLGAQALYLALRERTVSPADEVHEDLKTVPEKPSQAAAPGENQGGNQVGNQGGNQAGNQGDRQLEAIADAWRSGDFAGARRLASKECTSPACGALASELAEMLELTTRVDRLSDDELVRLSTFDKKLSNGRDSALRRTLENGRTRLASTSEAAKLFEEATEQRRVKNYERAVILLEKCIRVAPTYHPCYRLLGSAYALIATRDQSSTDLEKARRAYQRFLEVAPPDDEYVPKVSAILDSVSDDDDDDSPAAKRRVKDDEVVRVAVGKQKVISIGRPLSRVALGDPEIADVKTIGASQLQVTGHSAGTTTLLVWDTSNQRTTMLIEVSGSGPAHEVTLVPGGYTTVTLRADIVRVAIGNSDTAGISIQGRREVRIEGNKPGKTVALAWFGPNDRTSIAVEVRETNNADDKVQDLFLKATMARASGDYGEAHRHLLEILRLEPTNDSAAHMLTELRAQARQLYLRAYQIKEENPKQALRFFRDVMELTSPDDENHQKAKSWVNRLTHP